MDVDRQTQLLQRNVVAQATLDQVTAKQGEAQGNMLAQKAALEKAELQLSYTDIKSPISGRIGRASVSVGNFVSPSNGALATVVSQDPIYASFPVTQREMLAVRKQQAASKGGEYVIYVQLADGSRYPSPGKIDFLDNTVNPGTDTVQVRALFANPDRVLVDGQLVTVVAEEGNGESALLAPQQALQVDQTGPYVLVVDKDNKIQIRRVETDVARGANIVIRKGLAENELIVTEGIQRVRPGQVVAPTEFKPGAVDEDARQHVSTPPARSRHLGRHYRCRPCRALANPDRAIPQYRSAADRRHRILCRRQRRGRRGDRCPADRGTRHRRRQYALHE